MDGGGTGGSLGCHHAVFHLRAEGCESGSASCAGCAGRCYGCGCGVGRSDGPDVLENANATEYVSGACLIPQVEHKQQSKQHMA